MLATADGLLFCVSSAELIAAAERLFAKCLEENSDNWLQMPVDQGQKVRLESV